MRIVTDNKVVILLMRDDSYFEIDCPDVVTADRLKGILELGIADIVEQLSMEESDEPVSSDTRFPREIRSRRS